MINKMVYNNNNNNTILRQFHSGTITRRIPNSDKIKTINLPVC